MIKLKDLLGESNVVANSPGPKGYMAFLPSELWNKYKKKLSDSIKNTTGYIMVGLEEIPSDTIKKTDNPINKTGVSDKDISENIKLKDLIEDITIPVKVGDTILVGKFKNKKMVIKDIGTDKHGMPTINGRKATTFRIHKRVNIFDEEAINEAIPKLPRINMGFGEAQNYAKMMIKKSNDIIKHTIAGNMGKSQKIIKDMEEIVKQLKRVLGK
jgi:hypothetical protein